MKKNIFIGILLIGIIILTLYSYHFKKEEGNLITQMNQQDDRFVKNANVNCGGKIDPNIYTLGNNGCYFEYALQNESFGVCNKITDSFRFDCLRMIATIKNDISGCEKIIPFEEQQSTEDKKLSWGYNDVSALTQKEWCYADIAFKNKGSKICEKITTPESKAKCQKCAIGQLPDSSCLPIDRTPAHL